jgi:hypothetical protein
MLGRVSGPTMTPGPLGMIETIYDVAQIIAMVTFNDVDSE